MYGHGGKKYTWKAHYIHFYPCRVNETCFPLHDHAFHSLFSAPHLLLKRRTQLLDKMERIHLKSLLANFTLKTTKKREKEFRNSNLHIHEMYTGVFTLSLKAAATRVYSSSGGNRPSILYS